MHDKYVVYLICIKFVTHLIRKIRLIESPLTTAVPITLNHRGGETKVVTPYAGKTKAVVLVPVSARSAHESADEYVAPMARTLPILAATTAATSFAVAAQFAPEHWRAHRHHRSAAPHSNPLHTHECGITPVAPAR